MARSSAARTRKAKATRAADKRIGIVGIFAALKDAAIKAGNDGCIGLAKEAAYSFILSFFPMLLAFISLFFILGDPESSTFQILGTLRRMLPAESYPLVAQHIGDYLKTMAAQPPTRLFWFSLAGTLWTASGVMSTLQKAFNTIYDVKSTRSFWLRRFTAVLLVIAIGIPLLFSTVATVFSDQLERLLTSRYGIDLLPGDLWLTGRWAIVIVTTIMIAALLYRNGVERKQTWRGVLPGAVLATLLWLSATILFNRYVQDFASYNRVYGSLGAAIVLLVWMFLTALALLYGAEFNYQIERRSGAR